jgi:DNA polymerase-3 subunit beta
MEALLEMESKPSSGRDSQIKAEISLANLQKALKVIAPAIPGVSCIIPMLRSVHIEQVTDGLAITATDLETSIRALVPETTQLNTPLVMPSERFIPWIRALDGESVKLTATAARVTVQCGKPKVMIPRMNAHDFPACKFTSDGEGFEMMQDDLLRLLKHTSIAIGDEERYTLNGILLEADGTTLSAVAMDGHRMAIYTRPLEKTFRHLIPERMLKLLLPVIVEGKQTVRIQEEPQGFVASVAADIPVFISSVKPNGTFPNWRAVFPKAFKATVTVGSQELLRSLTRCLLIGDQKSHAVALEFNSTGIKLTAIDAQAGEAEESIDAFGGPAESVLLGVNGTYLAQALKQISGDVKVLLPTEDGRPVLFQSTPADGEVFNYIVMPMRINR